jgi:hypothetical protein
MQPDLSPGEALDRLLAFDGELRLEAYYGERSVFHNPRGVAPLGAIFASVKERDGPNDAAARFGGMPARPPKGGTVALPGWDLTRLDELTPHPVYAWMGWVQILSPSAASFERLQPLLAQSLDLARARWHHRGRHASD